MDMLRIEPQPPQAEPVTVSDLKKHLRIIRTESGEDDLLSRIITASREYAEGYTGRAIPVQTIKAYPEGYADAYRLPRPPVISVTGVTVKDGSGATHQLIEGLDYVADVKSGRVWIRNRSIKQAEVDPIEITYSAGYASVPAMITQAILMMAAHMYENREAIVNEPVASVEVKRATDALLNQYRVRWF